MTTGTVLTGVSAEAEGKRVSKRSETAGIFCGEVFRGLAPQRAVETDVPAVWSSQALSHQRRDGSRLRESASMNGGFLRINMNVYSIVLGYQFRGRVFCL